MGRLEAAESIGTVAEVNGSTQEIEISSAPYELCCCPKDDRVYMPSIPSLCAYNLPREKGYKIVMGLSKEKEGARTKLNIPTDMKIPFEYDLKENPWEDP